MANLFFITLLPLLLLIASTPISCLPLIGIRDDMSSEFVGVGLRDDVAAPIQKRKVDKPAENPFCAENQKMYEEYCENMWADRPARLQTALFQFCPGYENRCLH